MNGSRLVHRLGRAASRTARRTATRAVLVSVALVLVGGVTISLGGCGSDGSSSGILPTDPEETQEKITGLVLAPNGVLAAAPRWWERPLAFEIVTPAQALMGVSPVSRDLPVSLSMLDAVDFADGFIDNPRPLITAALTDDEGRFTIISPDSKDTAVCRKMLAAGGGEALTRALVFSHQVQIDAASEALVRVLLDYVAASLSHLCNYDTRDLTQLLQIVTDQTFSARGNTAAEINEDAYQRARNNRFVQRALVDLGN